MTDEIYERDPLDDAAYQTVHKFKNPATGKKGAIGLSPMVGMPASTIQNKANPNEENAQFGIKEARRVMLATGDKSMLHTLARDLGEACYELPVMDFPADMDLMQAWMEWQEEHAQTITKMKEILSDNTVTKGELDELKVEVFEDFEKGMKLVAEFTAIAEPVEKVTPINRAKS